MIDLIQSSTVPVSSTARVAGADRGVASEAAGAEVGDFGSVLKQLASEATGALKNAEALSIQGIRGQASVQQVVEAVMSAEQTLQGALAIRDKVVSAYLEISRMSI